MFQEVSNKPDFPALERDILRWWNEVKAFEKRRALNLGKKRWSFIDGPITANNPMGVHHAWGRTYKDLWHRYKAMQGFDTRYQNGFDGQGLWIEVEVEKELGFQTKRDIEAFGIARFVELCKERVRKFSAIQTQQSIRLGYWMDWDNSYHTMSDENNYCIWMFLKRCHEKGYIYKGHDVMPWCPRCATGISQHEIVTEGYQELTHRSVTLRFPLKDRVGESLLVWTTTPWTLTSNVAAAVHPDLTYVQVRQGNETYYLSKGTLHILRGRYEVLGELRGAEMLGWRYHGPYDELPTVVRVGVPEVHRVIPWDAVGEAEGTGIVHIAPGCGAEDFDLGQRDGLPAIAPLDEFGNFVEGFGFLSGTSVEKSADPIFADLEQKGLVYRIEAYSHRYPTCWRCKSELVFRLVDEWFISMDQLRHDIMAVTKQIRWIPAFGLERELDWLQHMDDWMISKKRYWGLALPIYECKSCGRFEVIGSEIELKERAVAGWEEFAGHSPHRPWIDAVKIRCQNCGAVVSRIPDVGNPWLDAGIVPYSTLDYRHNRAYWEKWFPAHFITESFPGQFRNWFYSLLAMSTVLENRPPFLTVLGYALVRDEHGEEMHKSKGNAIWFDDAAETIGVDTMRWMYCSQKPELNLNFGYGPANETRRRFLIPLWNVYSFLVTYARIDGWKPPKGMEIRTDTPDLALLDRWILAKLSVATSSVTAALDDYDAYTATRHLEAFVEDLSNWYVRRSRRRFWKTEADADKEAAYRTLYYVLVTLCKLLAPFIPFTTEAMYQNLVRAVDASAPESVHHNDWPAAQPLSAEDKALLADMDVALRAARLGRAARATANLKLRQPLARALVVTTSPAERAALERLRTLVADEVNVKELGFAVDEAELVDYRLLPNNKVLGPKFGSLFPAVRAGLSALNPNEAAPRLRRGESLHLQINAQTITLAPDEVLVQAQPKSGLAIASEDGLVVAVDTHVDESLADEGLAREFVRRVQLLRKEIGLQLDDRITLYYQADPDLAEVLTEQADYIQRETLATELVPEIPPAAARRETFLVGTAPVTVGIAKHRA